jgi:hypothetical protein
MRRRMIWWIAAGTVALGSSVSAAYAQSGVMTGDVAPASQAISG